jgi:hypothetical protein
MDAKTETKTAATELSPDAIIQLGLGFWASKALLSAVDLDLFTALPPDRSTARRFGNGSG